MRWVFCQALTHHLSKLTAPKIDTSIAAMSFENVRGRGTIELVGAEVFFSIFEMNLGGQIFKMVYEFLRMGGAGSVNPRGKIDTI